MSQPSEALDLPSIPLGLKLADGLFILKSIGRVVEESGTEHRYAVVTRGIRISIYAKDCTVTSVWYDDPTGRESEAGKIRKVELHLKRYGSLENWELRMENGWMNYWFNPKDKAAMVYGTHKDVIRFNQYFEPTA